MDPITRLKSYLKHPNAPSWSSQGLTDLFKDLQGDMKSKQQIILPIIDEKLHKDDVEMTTSQFNFLRAITLHAYHPNTRTKFNIENLKWLLDRFDKKPSQQRATLIVMLIDVKELSEERKHKIKQLLKGTSGASFYYDSQAE